MSDKLTLPMWEPVQAHKAMTSLIWPRLKAHLSAGRRMVLELRPEKRSDPQNRLLHAALTDISQQVEWMGKKLSVAYSRLQFKSAAFPFTALYIAQTSCF